MKKHFIASLFFDVAAVFVAAAALIYYLRTGNSFPVIISLILGILFEFVLLVVGIVHLVKTKEDKLKYVVIARAIIAVMLLAGLARYVMLFRALHAL